MLNKYYRNCFVLEKTTNFLFPKPIFVGYFILKEFANKNLQ